MYSVHIHHLSLDWLRCKPHVTSGDHVGGSGFQLYRLVPNRTVTILDLVQMVGVKLFRILNLLLVNVSHLFTCFIVGLHINYSPRKWKEHSFLESVYQCLLNIYLYMKLHKVNKQFACHGRSHWFIGDMVDSLILQSIFLFVNNFYFCILVLCVYGSYTM